ncbi:MAG: DUF2332 domain-containing protein [Nocardioides sp.]
MTPLVESLRTQALSCAQLGSPMYADLIGRVADDVETGGVCADILADYAQAPSTDAVGLRLMGSVHRLVLQRRAGALATCYPSVGGRWDPTDRHTQSFAWAAFRRLVVDHPDWVAEWLGRPPQTNEVGRSAALIGGLLHLPDRLRLPVRLFELGASAGLNLLADRFAYLDASGRRFGPAEAGLVFDRPAIGGAIASTADDGDGPVVRRGAWSGPGPRPWPGLSFIERAGCDLLPVDPRSAEGRLALTAYVWPDQAARLTHLRAALAVAARHRAVVHRQSAASFVETIRLASGAITVIWHSVMWQYLSVAERSSIDTSLTRLARQATDESPLVHLFFEPSGPAASERRITLQVWPGTGPAMIGTAPAHGLPCRWGPISS